MTLTVPEGGTVRESSPEFAAAMAAKGGGVLLFWDTGRNEKPHVHGFVIAPEGVDVVGMWDGMTGGVRQAQHRRRLTGWDMFVATGDDRLLRSNLLGVVHYMCKSPEVGPARDLRDDVWASGALQAAWRGFAAGGGGSGGAEPVAAPGAWKASQRRSGRQCAGCRGEIPAGKRSHASHCGARCRQRACRRRKAERSAS